MSDIPPPPPGFSLDPPRKKKSDKKGSTSLGTITRPVDGDTLKLDDGNSLRLWGVDAPELRQPGYLPDGSTVPVGQQSRNALGDLMGGRNALTGPVMMQSWGRPVAPVTVGGADAGQQMVRGGNALAAPDYLTTDPDRQFDYMQAERLARQNRLGPVNDAYVQEPAEFRDDPKHVVPRETVAQFWDTPTPNSGLPAEVEQQIVALTYDKDTPLEAVLEYARSQGAILKPESVKASREHFLKTGKAGGLEYLPTEEILTDSGDGASGAAVRGIGQGFVAGGLDELGAVADTLIPSIPGFNTGRENIYNSDRRVADIWANNQRQNSLILGYDAEFHPYARTGGEVAGALTSGFVIPFGQGARTVPQLARVGGVWGAAEGFLGTDGDVPQRLKGAAIGVPIGATVGAAGGKAIEVAAPVVGRAARSVFGRGAQDAARGTGDAVGEFAEEGAQEAAQRSAGDIPPPPDGYTLDAPQGRSVGMDAEPMPAVSGEVRQRDVIDVSPPARATRMYQPLTAAQRAAMAEDVRPQDVLPIPSNEVGSVDEAAAIDAGRIAPAKAPNERKALKKRTVTNFMGREVPKEGPLDLVGWLRTQGGLRDQGGELASMGISNNTARRGLDFVGQEMRFGPMVSERGMTLDDAALAAWEAGYFPEHTNRPDINTFLEALGETYNGNRGRRFLPEDAPELEGFYGRQAERYDLEQQELETGGSVFVDRSEAADEPAPFPPVEAYEEWPADAGTRAGNINLDKLESPQDIKRALVQTNNRVGFDAATRGRVTQAETVRLASELNMTPEALLARRKGQALNAEEALAARQILAKSGNELVNAAKKLRALGDDPGAEALADFRHKWMRHVAIQEQVSGMTAEAGRALQQFRVAATSRAVRGDVLGALVRGGGGKDSLQEAAGSLIDAVEMGPGKFNALAKQATKSKWRGKVAELYINFLLSNPATHVVNMTSNTLTAMAQLPEFTTAAMIGKARQAFSRNATDRVIASEVGARAFGLLQGAREGARLFARAVRTGEASDFVSKVEGDEYKAIPGVAGEIIRVPTRLLTAEDELFKGIARRMSLNGLAARQAHKEGLKGVAARKRIAELSADPTDDILEQSLEYGRYLTFQTKLGPVAQNISNVSQNSLLAKLYLPFVRTPTNLLKFAAERSPAAPFMPRWKKEFAAGGARRDLAVARMMLGTGFGIAIYQAALNGHITGALPSDSKKARLLRAEGWQEYSVKIGDSYYSYKRLDPFAMTLGVAADLATLPEGMSEREKEDKAALLVASIMGNLASKTWLSGVSDLVSGLDDPQRNAGNMIERLVGSMLVPAGVAGVARSLDPTAREVDGWDQAIMARVPGLRDNLRPRRDIWGEEVVYDSGFLSPAYTSEAKNDPVNLELLKLGDYAPGYPSKTVKGRELSPEEYDGYQEQAGKLSHERLTDLVTGPGWDALDMEAKTNAAKKTVDLAREEVREDLFGGGEGENAAAGSRDGGMPPPPPGFSVEGEAAGRNVYRDLQEAIPGVRFTSGFRDEAYQADMRARGYKPAQDSAHLDGSSFDLLPPPGRSMGWLKAQVKRYDQNARLLDEGDHLHVTFPGYYGAPAIGGARSAGLQNPLAGLPPPPPGFSLN